MKSFDNSQAFLPKAILLLDKLFILQFRVHLHTRTFRIHISIRIVHWTDNFTLERTLHFFLQQKKTFIRRYCDNFVRQNKIILEETWNKPNEIMQTKKKKNQFSPRIAYFIIGDHTICCCSCCWLNSLKSALISNYSPSNHFKLSGNYRKTLLVPLFAIL